MLGGGPAIDPHNFRKRVSRPYTVCPPAKHANDDTRDVRDRKHLKMETGFLAISTCSSGGLSKLAEYDIINPHPVVSTHMISTWNLTFHSGNCGRLPCVRESTS